VSDVNANIGIHFDTADALAQLRQLQAGLSKFNQALTEGNLAAANAQKGLNAQLVQSINSTGKFVASQRNIVSSTSAFTDALEKNKLSMSQYFKYTAAAATLNSKTLKGAFAQEKDILNRAMKDRVKSLQTQYIQLTNANGELVKVLQVVPKHLKMVNGEYADYATRTQMAAQRQQFFNQLIKQGSTQLLNFGKNTQWAGRQLMVGLTIPLSMLGSVAAKSFREMEQATVKFSRVYGDMLTSVSDTDKAIADIQLLAKEFTKFGVAAVDTMNMAAEAAAMGLTGGALQAQVTNATKLAVLGQVTQQEALETTISLQNAFGISAEELAKKINFLNAVENQTVLSISDLTTAIPKAAPVVKQLGGSVEDLAFFMTAMKEGGINASEGANALKSGLASMINPSKKAAEMLASLGINIKGIVEANAGDLKGTVVGFARALDTLAPLERSRAIEQLFGKFQFARISTLFQNITKEGSQASKTFQLAGASVEELAILSERELGKVENAVGVKFQKQLENLKLQLIPIGKAFLEAVTPVVQFAGKILEKFNNLSEGTKKFVVGFIAVLGGIAPVALMTIGLIANGAANLVKFFGMLRGGMAKLNGQNNVLGGGFDYLTQAEIDNLAQSQALHGAHQELISTFNVEKASLDALAGAYSNAASQARALASGSPGLFNAVPGAAGAVSGLPKYAEGIISVPGTGNKDTVPAMLTPGEAVVPAGIAQSPEGQAMLSALMNNNFKKYNGGTLGEGARQTASELMGMSREDFVAAISAMAPNAKSQSAVAKLLSDELTKAVDRVGPEFAERLKSMFAESVQGLETVTASAIENITKQTDAVTGGSFREQYHGTSATKFGDREYVFAHGADHGEEISDPDELARLATQSQRVSSTGKRTDTSLSKALSSAATGGGRAYEMSSFGFIMPKEANTRAEGGNFAMPKGEIMDLFTGTDAGKTLSPIYQEWARLQGITLEEAMNNPETMAQLQSSMDNYGGLIADEISKLPENFGEADFYDAVGKANARIDQADTTLRSAVDNLLKTTTYAVFSPDDGRGGQGNRIAVPKKSDVPLRGELGLQDEIEVGGEKITSMQGSYQKQNMKNLTVGNELDIKRAAQHGEAVGSALFDGLRGPNGTAAQSPSKKGIEAGREVVDGLVIGMQEGEGSVRSQASKLGGATIPTAADTASRVDKMDLTNKAFYDDLNTPELQYDRQVLKSQDRQRRKLGASRTVDAAYLGQNVIEEKSAMGISANVTINAEQQKADQLMLEAAKAEQTAARLRIEQAKWEDVGLQNAGKNAQSSKNAEELKALADEAELKAAKLRIKAAEAAYAAAKESAKSKKSAEKLSAAQTNNVKQVQNASNNAEATAAASVDVLESQQQTAKAQDQINNAKQQEIISSNEIAQTTERQSNSLITNEELINATQNSLRDSAENADQLNAAEEEAIKDAQKEAALNDQINAEKEKQRLLLSQYNAKLAAEAAAPVVPAGSQTGNMIPSTALSSVDAYEEAATYTRDSKGSVLIDPETGAPTTLSQKQLTKKKRGMRREKVGKFSGKASGALGTAAMVAGMAGAPPKVTAALGTAATVAQFAPMLAGMGPVGWAAAGIMAVGAGAYMLNKHFNKMAAEAAKFAISTSATRESMKKMGELTGKVGASEIMDRRRKGSQYGKYTESFKVQDTFGKKFMGSDLGKEYKKTFKENLAKYGDKQAADDLALKLAAQVADGVLTGPQAESIAASLGLALKNQKVEMQVSGKMRMLLGPNGENLEKEPLKSRVGLIVQGRMRSEKQLKTIEEKKSNGESVRKDIAALAAFNINNLELATMQADAVEHEYQTAKKKLESEIASTTNLQKKLKLQDELNTLNDTNAANTEVMNGQILRQLAMAENDFSKFYSDSVWGGQAMREDAYFDASRATVESAYKGTDQEKAAEKFLNKTKDLEENATTGTYNATTGTYQKNGLGTARAGQAFQAKMELLVGSKVLNPTEATEMMNLFSGRLDKLDFLLNVGIKTQGIAKTKELMGMFSGFTKKKIATEMIQQIILTKKNPAEFDATMEALKKMQSLNGTTIDFELLVSTVGLKGVETIQKQIEDIEKLKDDQVKKEGKNAKITTAEASAADPRLAPMLKQLEGNKDMWDKYNALTADQQAEWLQNLAVTYASEANLNEEQLRAEAELSATQAMMADEEFWGVSTTSQAYIDAKNALIESYMKTDAATRAYTKNVIGGSLNIPSLDAPPPPGSAEKGNRDTTYDDILTRLRNVRLAAINAAGGFAELKKAMAKTGIKAIKDQFNGLEQQMIKTGKTAQFTEYLAGLDQETLNKFGKAATKAGVDPNTGKKKKGVKKGDFVLNDKGKLMEQGFNKAIAGDYNKAQLLTVQANKQEIAARTKLVALGYNQADIQTMLADENYRTLIATGKITQKELETNAALTAQARIRSKISALFQTGQEATDAARNQKRIPEVVSMMQQAGVSAEGIREALADPAMLDQLITGMDNFATMGEDAKNQFNQALGFIDEIPDRKIIELVFTQTDAQKKIAGADAAAEMFDAYKMIDENTLKNKEGNTYASLQVKMDDLNNQSKIAQDAINITQSKIDGMQQEVDKMQRDVETNFTRPIEQRQRSIDKLNRTAEMNYTRPIQALQDRSAILSHDLDVMNHAAEAINEKYDKQQEALSKVQEINQRIIEQQQQQLGLADALSRGDIAAAAKAAQDMRASQASAFGQNAQQALQQARQNELGAQRGGVTGKSQKDIQEEQWQISQQVYNLELGKAAIDKQILSIQDEIYNLEQGRQAALDAIQVKTDAIAKIQYGTLLDQQNALKAITDQVLPLQQQSDILFKMIADNDKNRIIQGATRQQWLDIKSAAEATEKLAKGDLAKALGVVGDVSKPIATAWGDIKTAYDAIKSKSIEITQYVKTIQAPMPAGANTTPSTVPTPKVVNTDVANSAAKTAAIEAANKALATANDHMATAKRLEFAVGQHAARAMQADAQKEIDTANAALAQANAMSAGGLVPKYFAKGGFAIGTDTVPAMLTPGEFVMSRYAVNNHGVDTMRAINAGASVGDSVYNYSLTVNAKSDSSADDIARTVMAQIKQIDAQRIRGVRV
jgi:hypothetical protein